EQAIERRPDAVDGEGARACTDRERESGHECIADDALAWMLADAGRDIHGRIRVMHAMVEPEARNAVHGDMRDVEGEVQHHEGDETCREGSKRNHAEQAEALRLEPEQRHYKRGVHERIGRKGEEREGNIWPKMKTVPSATGVKRHRGLDQGQERHRGKNSSDCGDGRRERCEYHWITSWSGMSFAGSRMTRIATMRPPDVSTWTEANTACPALGSVATTAGSAFRCTMRHSTGMVTRRTRLAKRRRSARAPNVGRRATCTTPPPS